jgi:hypothetical protein
MKQPKPKRPSMTKAKDYADKWMSKFIRARDIAANNGMCLICGIRPIEVNYHIFPRGNMATRYEARACVGSCRGCNYNECIDRREANKERLKNIYIKLMGLDLYEQMYALSKSQAKLSVEDIMEIGDKFKAEYEKIALDNA